MLHSVHHDGHLAKVRRIMKSGEYSTGKQNKGVKSAIKKAVKEGIRQHEEHDHPGKKITHVKLKEGGIAHGEEGHKRLDKHSRGGKTKHKGGSHVHVNVVVPQGGKQPVPVPVAAGAPALPPRPPLPPAGAMPPVMGPAPMAGMPPRPPGMKRGGAVDKCSIGGKQAPDMDAGAGGAKGRLEKMEDYGTKPKKK